MKYIIGIDIGKKGAICVMVKDSRKIEYLSPMPLLTDGDINGKELLEVFSKYSERCHCYIEKLHAMPLFGAKGNFGFGGQYYTIKTLLRVSNTPFTEVMAKVWQKTLFASMKVHKKPNGHVDTKKMACIRAQDLFPNVKFLPTKSSRKIHDGMVDSSLICYFGVQVF